MAYSVIKKLVYAVRVTVTCKHIMQLSGTLQGSLASALAFLKCFLSFRLLASDMLLKQLLAHLGLDLFSASMFHNLGFRFQMKFI